MPSIAPNEKNLSPKELAALIEKRERKFNAASPAGKRVMLAQDVLDQLDNEALVVARGNFIRNPHLSRWSSNPETDVRSVLPKIPPCTVCAIGSLMLSAIRMKNKIQIQDYSTYMYDLGNRLFKNQTTPNGFEKLFSKKQFMMIEIAFEGGYGYCKNYTDGVTNDIFEKGTKFTKKLDANGTDSEGRLRAIMENIIKNKGQFKP